MTISDHNRATSSVALLAATALISACASTSKSTHATLQSIPLGSSIRVVAVEPEIETPDARTAGETVAKGTAAGAAAGAAVGAATYGVIVALGCGSFVVICGPIMLVTGVASGAIAGAAAFGIETAMLALPKEKAEALEAVMADTIAGLSVSQMLVQEFTEQSGNRWTVTDAEVPTEITLGIEGLFVDQGKDDQLVVKLVNSMVISYGPGELDTTKRILFTYVSERHHVDHWIEKDGANFQTAIYEGFASNMEDMVKVLQMYSP